MALTTIPVELLTLDDGVTISTADNDAQLILVSTDADANIAPLMQFYRNSDTPADNDQIGRIEIYGENDNDEKILYSEIVNQIKDASDGSEDGRMAFNVMTAGTAIARMDILPTETVFNEGKHDVDFRVESDGIANMLFVDAGNDRVMIGGNDPEVTFEVDSGSDNTVAQFTSTDAYALIKFKDNDTSTETTLGALDNDMVFRVGDAERMRIDNAGDVIIGDTSVIRASSQTGVSIEPEGRIYFSRGTGTGGFSHLVFYNGNEMVGTVTSSGSATAYNTSSDYRLKENVTYDWDGLTKLKQLKPAQFNFKVDPDTTIDGFLAHEAQTVVPEAVTGTHNETEDVSNAVLNAIGNVIDEGVTEDDWKAGKEAEEGEEPKYAANTTWKAEHTKDVYQGIDQSKLVPLLVKAVQEQQTLIETLQTKVKALEEA